MIKKSFLNCSRIFFTFIHELHVSKVRDGSKSNQQKFIPENLHLKIDARHIW